MTHSNVFYILSKDGFHAEKNAIPVPNKTGLDLFRIGYNISEGRTGKRILPHDTQAAMLETVKKIENDPKFLSKIEAAISKSLEQPDSLSPRYTRPDEKYEELFPAKAAAARRKPKAEKTKAVMRKEEQSMYELAVSAAEKAIYQKQPLVNSELRDKPILLSLVRENSVSLPRKTKDWIVSSLLGVEFDESRHMWVFRYNGKLDPQFRFFFEQLCLAIHRKHGSVPLKGISNT